VSDYNNWSRGAGGTSWIAEDAEGCTSSSGAVRFDAGGQMSICVPSISPGPFFFGMKAKGGNLTCFGTFDLGTNCDGGFTGAEFINFYSSGSATWYEEPGQGPFNPTSNGPAQSVSIACTNNSSVPVIIDQIYFNKGSSTGFGGN
jgi:hypothetical protein